MENQTPMIEGILLNEDTRCSFPDLCRLCGVSAEIILEMIEEGIISPEYGHAPPEWQFTHIAIKRVQITVRLQQDLRVNLPGCALALDLLEELQELRLIAKRT